MAYCSNCGKAVSDGDRFCPGCGREIMGYRSQAQAQSQPFYEDDSDELFNDIEPEVLYNSFVPNPNWPIKNKIVAGVLGITLGGIGVHKFYLNKPWEGLLMLFFSWTGIPEIVGFVQGIIMLCQSDESFMMKNKVIVDNYR